METTMMKHFMLASLFISLTAAQDPPPNPTPKQPWFTLNGQQPLVIARGGFPGLFPYSSAIGIQMVPSLSLQDTVYLCDLQLTQDAQGFCLPGIKLDNTTDIALVYPQGQKTYLINGKQVRGWFALDYLAKDILPNVTVSQNILSRSNAFDGQPLLQLENMTTFFDPPAPIWVNVQYDMFYNEHKVSPALYLEKMRFAGINYISCPEIGFLKSIGPKVDRTKTKLVLRFLALDDVEPTTKETYAEILKNLAAIKSFASGILVPKTYIWPVNKDMYLLPPTTLVTDAHNEGLEVYAFDFANDFPGSFNYSYDPTAEYLQFIDNGAFSVDGVLTDFPPTASEAIACLAHNKNASKPQNERALIITHNGASGDYPGCTDLAYEKAVTDGADIIDCSVQMSKDGVAFCLDTADLLGDTNAITLFISKSSTVPEIQPKNGIFTFDLTWNEIKTLKPQIVGLNQEQGGLPRNPANKAKGKFLTLTEFLNFAKAKAVSGVLINIENAAYLASKKGLDIISTVTTALSNATMDKQPTQKVMIQSDDTSVLSKFKAFPKYQRVYTIKEVINSAPKESVDKIKKFADAVDVRRPSVIRTEGFFLDNFTLVVEQMHAANLSVHVSVLYNEYSSLAFDFFADPLQELATIVEGLKADAIVTEFPATATAYMRTPCSDPKNNQTEFPIVPLEAGFLLHGLLSPQAVPPMSALAPNLNSADIVDPPLPPLAKLQTPTSPSEPEQNKAASQLSSRSLYLSIFIPMVVSLYFVRGR